jgi:hypothetical protein
MFQASAFDLGYEVLEEGLRQPGVGVKEEDQVCLSAVASYIPATRDGRLAVDDYRDGRCSAMRTAHRRSWRDGLQGEDGPIGVTDRRD